VICRKRNGGWMVAELLVAIAILALAMIPLAYSFRSEERLVRAHYNEVVAMEIIDGEMEMLRAGNWRAFLEGEQEYPVIAESRTNLPAGKFLLIRSNCTLRLEWRPEKKGMGGIIRREALVP
jgi:hypothetical protein